MKQPDRTNIDFSINNTTLVFGLSITFLVMVAVYGISIYFKHSLDFKDYISIFTCGIVCTTLLYHSKNVTLTHKYHEEKLAFDKEKFNFEKDKLTAENKRKMAEYSLLVCSEWFKPGMCEQAHLARKFLNANKENVKGNIVEFIKILDEIPENRKAVVTMLNYFEHIALLIEKGLVEEDIIKDAFKTLFCDYYSLLKPYIKERQTESARFIVKYEALARKWSLN